MATTPKRRRLPKRAPETTTPALPNARAFAGGRLSRDADAGLRIGNRLSAIVPPPSVEDTWRSLTLDDQTLARVTPIKLAEYLADISPEVSRALWDFLRECNAGHEITAMIPGTDEPDPRAQDALDAFLAHLGSLYGTLDVQITRLFLAIFLRGALCSELVLDQQGRAPVDLAVVDPAAVRARRIDDPVRGTMFEYGQMQDGHWVPFDRPTVSYIPVDPLPGVPYGRPPVAPALFTALFLIGVLHDLRRVIAQQGYPRYDIEIVLDELAKQMPANLESDITAQNAWMTAIVSGIADDYAALEPESAWTHTSAVRLNRPISAVDSDSLGGIGPIIEALERMAVRALKTAPFMLGISESTTETQANRQFEQHAITIRAIQHLVETQLSHLFGLALQCQGIVATVSVRFAENRRSERLRYAQAEQLEIANERAKYDHGWISQDEAAQAITGHPSDQPEPRSSGEAPAPDPSTQENPEPGANRAALNGGRRAALVPLGAEDGFGPIPAVTISDDDLQRAVERWDDVMPTRVNGLLSATVVNGEGDDDG